MSKGLRRLFSKKRARWGWATGILAIVVAGGWCVGAAAHTYCKPCKQTCHTSAQTGCEVYYANPGVFYVGTCHEGGGGECDMTATTRCYTTKKICSQSVCAGSDCSGGPCTTYPYTTIDGSTTFTGDTECPPD